jgi:hypothetical protein
MKGLDQSGDSVALCACGIITECAIVGRYKGAIAATDAQQACNYYNRRCGMKSASIQSAVNKLANYSIVPSLLTAGIFYINIFHA